MSYMQIMKYVQTDKYSGEFRESENPKFAVTNVHYNDEVSYEAEKFVKTHDFEIPEEIKDYPLEIKEYLENSLLHYFFPYSVQGFDVYDVKDGCIIHKQVDVTNKFNVFDLLERVPYQDYAFIEVYKDKVFISYDVGDEQELYNVLDLERVKNGQVSINEVMSDWYIQNMVDAETISDEELEVLSSPDFKFESCSDRKIEKFRVKEKPELVQGEGNQYSEETYDEYEKE